MTNLTNTLTKEQLNTLQRYINDALEYADENDTIGDHFTNIKDGVIKFVDETYTHLVKDTDEYECCIEDVNALVAYPNIWWADVVGADK
jgi:hypothetical protein